jgi:rod shape-determining protein MreC
MQQQKQQRNRLLTVGMLVVASVILLTVGSGFGETVGRILIVPFAPLAGLLTGGANGATGLVQPIEDPVELKRRNLDLERTVAGMQIELVQLREIEQDYKRLSGLANYISRQSGQTFVTADVIAIDTSSYLRWIIINRGARDGIAEGNPVISDLGLVGRVEDVAANASWVRLMIDPASVVNGRLQTSRAEGTISGQLQGGLLMDLIPQDIVVQPGDLVLTSGLGGTYPGGIVIGQVASVTRQPAALFQQADIRPTVNFADLEIISVITSFQQIDTSIFDQNLQGTPQP